MGNCPFMEGCIFYRGQMPTTTELLKNTVCKGNHISCARCMVALVLGRERVPPDLYPSDVARAKDILKKNEC
jgi:hypothetical protein